jgi:hypothetical protein
MVVVLVSVDLLILTVMVGGLVAAANWPWDESLARFEVFRLGSSSLIPTLKGGHSMPMGQERTKEQLYQQAKRLDIKGRSKMNKGQLKAALARRGHWSDLICSDQRPRKRALSFLGAQRVPRTRLRPPRLSGDSTKPT